MECNTNSTDHLIGIGTVYVKGLLRGASHDRGDNDGDRYSPSFSTID